MQLRYDEDLVESVMLLFAGNRRSGIPSLQLVRFHAERDRLYRIADADQRNAAFFKLHLEWFREWGVESAMATIAEHFPELKTFLQVLAFRKARGKHEEAGELYVNESGARHGMIAVRPERFCEMDSLESFLNHELQHLSDMVDPAFGYSPRVRGAPASPERLIRERYRLLWDVSIDGRLLQGGRSTVATKEQRQNEFNRAHAFLPLTRREQVFQQLWADQMPTHSVLLALAADPKGLKQARRPEPGATCPLCGFPSFHWTDATALPPSITAQILAEFADWQPEHGVCRRCVEVYESLKFHET